MLTTAPITLFINMNWLVNSVIAFVSEKFKVFYSFKLIVIAAAMHFSWCYACRAVMNVMLALNSIQFNSMRIGYAESMDVISLFHNLVTNFAGILLRIPSF